MNALNLLLNRPQIASPRRHFHPKKTNQVVYVLIDKNNLKTAYQDLTGRFPIKSSRGNEYILIECHYDANCILGYPIKDQTAQSITNEWELLHLEFTNAGEPPDVWVLDNEISDDFKTRLNNIIRHSKLSHRTHIVKTWPREQSRLGRIISRLVLQQQIQIFPCQNGIG